MAKALKASFLMLCVLCSLQMVPAESCGGDENAVSGCGMGCVKKCSNYWRKDIACTANCELNGCSCKADYVYDENIKKCVKIEQCSPVCGQNEKFSTCTNGGCYGARNCSEDINTPVKCVKIAADACEIGCICEEGYLRNANGVCVAMNECSGNKSCDGDENAFSSCGMGCVKKCSNYWRDDIMCTADCELGACTCKDDFVYDENINKCVPYWQCTPLCGQNEKFSNCTANGCFSRRNCSDPIDTPRKCVKISEDACEKGCICEEGYLRNKNGVCVPEDECAANEQCDGVNVFYDTCPPNNCEPETCVTLEKPIENCPIQPAVCRPRCRCAKGFYQNTAGECIAEKYCPKSCPENEYWNGCYNGGCFGPRKCAEKHRGKVCVRLIDGACKGACLCKGDLLRNDEGKCVKRSECPTIQDE
ncbi:zonadhesin-like isoform X2 [Pectinophora gossypiella]|uniref:zonadhesin-like isoform X2 n=1 Tax=Pectinophora gossypiella TaxID=13191 RepID=UPI00214E8E55|nr:zonadhesin-like isoform X2 [Pectinophora gossypiella]